MRRLSRIPEPVAVVAGAAILAICLTWPLAMRIGSSGRVDTGDGRFSIWNVAWVANTLTSRPSDLFDANIFSPQHGALAYSEANLVAGVLAIPVWLATRNPYAASNWTILCSFVLAAIAMYSLVRHLTGSAAGAGLAAIKYAFCAYAFAHIPQVQLLMTFGPALALLAMHRFVERPGLSRATALGFALALQGLACGYYGVFGGLAVALGVVWFAIALDHWRSWRFWGLALAAAAIAALAVAPFFAPYLTLRSAGFERTLDEARIFSVRWRSYLASPMWIYQWVLPILGSWRDVLFPGFVPVVLAGVAVAKTFWSRFGTSAVERPIVAFYLVLTGLSVWSSVGPDGGLYTLLYHAVPLFSLLRAPARVGLLVTLAVAVLGGIGLAALDRRWRSDRRRLAPIGIIGLALVSSVIPDLGLVAAPNPSKVHRWLAALPRGPVAEFPYFATAADRHRHTEYMLMSAFHWQPLVNGYSDYIPERSFNEMSTLAEFPAKKAWQVLRAHEARYVVIHWNLYAAADATRVSAQIGRLGGYLVPMVRDEDASLFQIVKWPDAADTGHTVAITGPDLP